MDQLLMKTGTFTTFKHTLNMSVTKYRVSPVLKVTMETQNLANLPKLSHFRPYPRWRVWVAEQVRLHNALHHWRVQETVIPVGVRVRCWLVHYMWRSHTKIFLKILEENHTYISRNPSWSSPTTIPWARSQKSCTSPGPPTSTTDCTPRCGPSPIAWSRVLTRARCLPTMSSNRVRLPGGE